MITDKIFSGMNAGMVTFFILIIGGLIVAYFLLRDKFKSNSV